MSILGYFSIGIVFVLLIIGIAKVENKYDKKVDEISSQLDKLGDEIWEIKDNYGELEHRIDILESEITPANDNDSLV